MSSAAVTTASRLPEQFAARRYRGACGNEITLQQVAAGNGAVEYVLRDESHRRGYSGLELGLLCLALALWTYTGSPACAALGLLALAAIFKSALFFDRTNTLLLVESVGVHIINRKTIFGALEEYLPWNSITDVFINEVISEQKVLYYLTFIVKEITGNGEERIRLIPLFPDLKPERKCLEYMYVRLADSIGKTGTKNQH